MQGPDKIAENLVRGVQSLMGHTVGKSCRVLCRLEGFKAQL